MFPMKKEEMTQNSVPNKCHQAEKRKKNKEQTMFTILLQRDGAGWWLLAGLVPTHRVAMEPPSCAWYLCRDTINL